MKLNGIFFDSTTIKPSTSDDLIVESISGGLFQEENGNSRLISLKRLKVTFLKNVRNDPIMYLLHIVAIFRIKRQMSFFSENAQTKKTHRYQEKNQIRSSGMH